MSRQRVRGSPRLAAAGLVAVIVLAGCGTTHDRAASTSPAAHRPSPTHAAASRMYWGAWIGKHLTGSDAPWSMRAVSKFEALTGKRVSLLEFSSPFADCRSGRCIDYSFPTQAFDNVQRHGAIPFFSWASYAPPLRETQSHYRLADIADGRYDDYVRGWAQSAKRWGHPFFLRFDWEMNGHWFPWSEGVNRNRPGDFVKAWRHVHDVFASAGATNVNWVWCPFADYAGSGTPVRELYPGDAFVDWTCVDGYNYGKPWKTFESIVGSTYDLIASIAPTKPMVIGETASSENGGSKAAWITTMFADLRTRFPKVRALLWFEKYDSGMDWPIETSPSATAAFGRGVRSPLFASNTFRSLAGGRIEPLP